MFICQVCFNNSKPKESSYLKVVEIRNKDYKNQVFYQKGRNKGVKVVESEGKEIVKEIVVCKKCKGDL